jgi:hypothetical protein
MLMLENSNEIKIMYAVFIVVHLVVATYARSKIYVLTVHSDHQGFVVTTALGQAVFRCWEHQQPLAQRFYLTTYLAQLMHRVVPGQRHLQPFAHLLKQPIEPDPA